MNNKLLNTLIDLIKDSKITLATEYKDGLLSKTDKEKLNNLENRLNQLVVDIMADIDFKVSEPVFNLSALVRGYTKTFLATANSLYINNPLDVSAFILTIPELNISRQVIYSDYYSKNKVVFKNLSPSQSITIDGLTLTATDNTILAENVALGFANLTKGSTTGNTVTNGTWSGSLSNNWHSVSASNEEVTFISENINEETTFNYSVAGENTLIPTVLPGKKYIGSATISVTVPLDFEQDEVTLRIYAVDTNENRSQTTTQNTIVTIAKVIKPRILSPNTDDLELTYHKGLNITTSDFDSTIEDTHKSTSYKLTSDELGNNTLITNSDDLTNLTNYTFSSNSLINCNLQPHTDYYLHTKHVGNVLGSSEWSTPRRFRVKEGVVTKNGRFIYRHPSDKGIVIEWELGDQLRKLFVYDEMAYNLPMLGTNTSTRYSSVECESMIMQEGSGIYKKEWVNVVAGRTLYGIGIENAIPGTTSSTSSVNNGADSKFTNSSNDITAQAYTSSRILCNFWFTLNDTNEAQLVNYARSINDIEGIDNLDIPSLRELQVILTEFNTDSFTLSKDRQSSFFADKLASLYICSNTFYFRSYWSNGSKTAQNVECKYLEYYQLNTSTGVASMTPYGYYSGVYSNTVSSYVNKVAYSATDVSSFLVRDITDF